MDSILLSIKALLGIDEFYTQFDNELILFINGAISQLIQIGVDQDSGFRITGQDETWEQLFGTDVNLEMAKTYIFIKVRLLFDPPANSFIVDAYKKEADELASRLTWQWDQNHPKITPTVDNE